MILYKRILIKTIKVFPSIFIFMILFFPPLKISVCFGERFVVAASIYPVADMVKQVGGKYVEVITVIPPSASPHTFEPKPSLVKKIYTSRIFFMIGCGLEFWAEKLIKPSGNRPKIVTLSEGIKLIRITRYHSHGHKDENRFQPKTIDDYEKHRHYGGMFANPHIWLDPEIAKAMVKKIVIALGKIDSKKFIYYKQKGDKFLNDLEELHHLILATVETFKVKKFVALHPAWEYFGQRYGLKSVGIIEESPGKNPTPKHIKKIVDQIKQHSIRAVFAEPQINPKVAEVISKEANVVVLLLDPIGGPGIKGRRTYIELMRYNLRILRKAMEHGGKITK